MFACTLLARRTPMIKFTYALKKGGGGSAAASSGAASAVKATAAALGAAKTGGVLLDTEDQLPERFRSHVFTEREMEMIMLGGAEPYVPKHLQKKKK